MLISSYSGKRYIVNCAVSIIFYREWSGTIFAPKSQVPRPGNNIHTCCSSSRSYYYITAPEVVSLCPGLSATRYSYYIWCLKHRISVSLGTIDIFSLAVTMDVLAYYWATTWVLSFMSAARTKAWMMSSITTATTPYNGWATFINILVWLHTVAGRKYLHLQDITPSLVKFYTKFGKHFEYGRYTWTTPGKWNFDHRCFEPSTGCTKFASDELYACCSVCNPHPTANITPEIVHNLDVSKEIVTRQDTTISAVL